MLTGDQCRRGLGRWGVAGGRRAVWGGWSGKVGKERSEQDGWEVRE